MGYVLCEICGSIVVRQSGSRFYRCTGCGHRYTLEEINLISSTPESVQGPPQPHVTPAKKPDCVPVTETDRTPKKPGHARSEQDVHMDIQDGVLLRCTGSASHITVPDGVTAIGGGPDAGQSVFAECPRLTTVSLPRSTTWIRWGAFQNCTSLTSVDLSDGVTVISPDAFRGCSSLTGILLPDSLTLLDMSAFEDCSSLRLISIPQKIRKINTATFRGCTALRNIILPDEITEIGSSAFFGCRELRSINIPTEHILRLGKSVFDGTPYHEEFIHRSMLSLLVPSSSTWHSFRTPFFSSCMARFRPVWPPMPGMMASGRS